MFLLPVRWLWAPTQFELRIRDTLPDVSRLIALTFVASGWDIYHSSSYRHWFEGSWVAARLLLIFLFFYLLAGGFLWPSALALASRCSTRLVVSFNFLVLSVLAFRLLVLGSSAFWFPVSYSALPSFQFFLLADGCFNLRFSDRLPNPGPNQTHTKQQTQHTHVH